MSAVIQNKQMKSRSSKKFEKKVGRFALYFVLAIFVLFFLMPLVVMLIASLKDLDEVRNTSIFAWSLNPTLQPWKDAWDSACVGIDCVGLKGFYHTTLIMVIPAVLISTLIGAFNGYALTKFNFKGSKLVYSIILFGSFVPYQAVVIPIAKSIGWLGLADSLYGLVLVHVVYGIPFTTMFFRNYFISVPQELIKAAQVDGAGFNRIFFEIVLPLSVPMIVVTIIFQFTGIWNDFLFGVSFTSGSNTPIMVALNNMVSTSTGEKPYNTNMAAAILAALPTLVVYFLAGKYFVRGLMAGAVKG
ncbi:carbohydrate ABC transporter permease [Leeia sp. TBRC 13508]|uniref:Carbohydrate ABC transporter permease n=2 Tax=Leeia speluncae TaxID=2884804 RepID=A0ABS8D897_9NEIS|nr:carbohydrate ABC transporter permease [Leeia speluncae]MCB6184433.1 carbohydrate ABC transporter permease [Leeia speluncae]